MDFIKNKLKPKALFLIGGIALLVIILISVGFEVKIQLLEFAEIGQQYTSVYWTNFIIRYATMLGAFVIIYGAIFFTNKVITKNLLKFFKEENLEQVKLPNKSIAFFIAVIASFVIKDFLSANILVYLNSTSFEISDSIFSKDIGYYMFQRPFLIDLATFIKGLILALIIYTLGYYVVIFGSCFDGIVLTSLKKNNVVKHNLINVALFFLFMALTYNFTMEDSLFGTFAGGLIGAGYTEINIRLWAYRIAIWLIIAVVVIAYVFLERNKFKKAIISMFTIPAFWIITYIVIGLTQVFFVTPNEFAKESRFIEYNMKNTKQAYGLNLEEMNFPVASTLDENAIKSNANIINNIQVVDADSTLKALNQSQATRGYYKFKDADISNYNINGESTTAYISAREVNTQKMNYINRKFQYTHGFGVVMNSINNMNKDGEPEFILKDLKPEMSLGDLKITQPRIYFGEMTDDYVIVNGKGINEIDYPEGDKSVETRYTGTAGIKMNLLNRVLMSIRNADIQMLVSGYIDSDSKLLINRNIIDRVEKIAPFLRFDENAYIVVNDEGRLFWVIDGYTMSTQYPYAEYFEIEGRLPGTKEKYNYIRNSVKVLVDAYNGDVKLYITDRRDPIIMAYNKAYPDLFADLDTDTIPDDIQEHIIYPKKLFSIQAEKLEKYHVSDVNTFYKSEDVWNIATHQTGNVVEKMKPYYSLVRLPGEDKEEFVLMLPYTPQGRNSLTSWFTIRTEKGNYGDMRIYKFPKDANVLGTIQLDNKIDQDSQISKDLNLWSGGGTKVSRGMTVIPVANSLLYIEPICIEAVNENAVPQVKKVAVSYNNSLAIENNLVNALKQVINNEKGTIKIEIDEDSTLKDTIEQTLQTYQYLKQASTQGSWEEFGKQMSKLEELLNKLNEQKAELYENEQVTQNLT